MKSSESVDQRKAVLVVSSFGERGHDRDRIVTIPAEGSGRPARRFD